MCGIVGIIGLNGQPVDPDDLQRMNDLQQHRGPDGEGFVLGWGDLSNLESAFVRRIGEWAPRSSLRLGLGHRRLAIIDLSDRGLQPMPSKDGRLWIVFNGEIYNFRELRSELQQHGRVFETETDTEVLLQAYAQWGEDCLSRLRGMFGFAIWDSLRGRLFCARDRFGIKPFYYATCKGYFIFASEMKSILSFPGIEAAADDDAVLDFMVHVKCDYGDRTMFRAIKALPPAHSLTLHMARQEVVINRYWHPEPQPDRAGGDDEQIEELKALLIDTMRRHLISDVRAGSCLSGGLDSSAVVGLVSKILSERPEDAAAVGESLCTFTSCWEYKELDEREYALRVASSVKASPHLVFPAPEEFWSDFERLAWHQDMPFASSSYYAQWCLMRAAKEAGLKVLLDGQGGDEVFGGYAKFRYAYLASLLRAGRIPKAIQEVGATLRQGDRYVLDIRNGYRYLPARIRSLMGMDSLMKSAVRADWNRIVSGSNTPAARWWNHASANSNGDRTWTIMQRIQIDDILIDTLPGLLRTEDRSSMAFSLEARVPLLDHKVVEYALPLPDHLKVHRGWSKFAIRQAIRGLIPDSVRLRKTKLGFEAPDRIWLSRDLRARVAELLADSLRCNKYVDTGVVRRWYNSPSAESANEDSYRALFRLLSLEMWMRVFKVS